MGKPVALVTLERAAGSGPWHLWWLATALLSLTLWGGIFLLAAALGHFI